MDEVMADTMQRCLDLYNSDFELALTPAHFNGRSLFETIELDHRAHVASYFQREDFFADIEVMKDSQSVVRALSESYEVFIVSAAMEVPCSFAPKYEWLQTHFPFIPSSRIVFCGDKSIVCADYLIDDNIRQLTAFRGEGIIFTAPHNLRETRFRRVSNWNEVRNLFLPESDRSLIAGR
ncbi:MAG: 5'-3'-deoxyribonucleotidase [Acidobacteriaceae bacterium]|nr:5'-3'-deoxyribonucleotidase [Acidobacteriaceae bacterium]